MNPMMILEMMFGKEKANVMWQQWEAMTPEQKQEELGRVRNMSDQEKDSYLRQRGSSLTALKGNGAQQDTVIEGRRFNY